MRTIRPAPKAAKNQMIVAKPGAAPAQVRAPKLPLAPAQAALTPGAPSTRDYGKQAPQINPPTGLPGQGI